MTITAAKLLVQILGDTVQAEKALGKVNKGLDGFANKAEAVGALLTKAVTLPLVGLGAASLKVAGDFDANMAVLQATSKATGADLEMLRAMAEELGEDLTLPGTSAADAAEAMLELSKAGLDVNEIMGAARGVLQLSAAGQLSNAAAAEAAADALNAFNLEGDQAVRVADLLAASSNASSAEVSDMSDGMKMAAAVFAAADIPIEDLVTTLAQMANAGIKGSDAGTSLKQMILSLQAPTDKASGLMEDLGIQIYDASGQMLDMDEIISSFNGALSGLTQEQRNAALATIFGSDAVRAANVVLMGGVDAFTEMKVAVTETGAAADLAAARMEGLKGSAEKLKSSIETALLAGIQPFKQDIEDMTTKVAEAVNSFNDLDEAQQKNIVKLGLLAAGAGPAMIGLSLLARAGGSAVTMLGGIPAILTGISQGFAAWRAGMTLTTALGVAGLSPMAIALGGIALTVGSVVAVWATWNTQIKETNEEGRKLVGGAMAEFFNQQVESGKDASVIIGEYLAMVGRMQNIKAEAGIVGWFVDLKGPMADAAREMGEAVAMVGGSYRDYAEAVLQAQVASGKYSQQQADWILRDYDQGKSIDVVITALGGLEKKEFGMVKVNDLLNRSLESSKGEAVEMAAAFGDVDAAAQVAAAAIAGVNEATTLLAGIPAAEIMGMLNQAMADQSWSALGVKIAQDNLAVSLGSTTQAQVKLANDTQLVIDAFAAGVIGADRLAFYMDQAQGGTLNLAEVQRNSMQAATDHANALRGAAQAANDAYLAQLNLAQSLKDATSAQIAQAAIGALTDAMKKGGTEDAPAFLTAIAGVQEAFGLSDEKSRALAEGIGIFTEALATGQLPAENFDEALKNLISDAEDGVVDFDAIIKSFQNTPAAATEAEGAFGTASEALLTLGEDAFITTGLIEDAFVDKNWQGLGSSISDGIAAGINAGIPAIQAAAIKAAQAALAAAEAELDINTPSKAAARQIGKPFDEGIAKGVRDNMGMIYSAISETSAGMLGSVSNSYSISVPVTATVSREIDIYVLAREVASEIKRSRL